MTTGHRRSSVVALAMAVALLLVAGVVTLADRGSSSASSSSDGNAPGSSASRHVGGKANGASSDVGGDSASRSQDGTADGLSYASRNGRYRYRYVAEGDDGQRVDAAVVATITTVSRSGTEVLQHTRYDAHLAGSDTAWRPDGEYVAAAGERGECRFEPAIRRVPLPLIVGLEWTGQGQCTVGPARQTLRVEGKVVGRETARVGSSTVDVFRLEFVTTDVGDANGVRRVARRTTTELFAPSLGVTVETLTRIQPGPGSTGGTRRRTLLAVPA